MCYLGQQILGLISFINSQEASSSWNAVYTHKNNFVHWQQFKYFISTIFYNFGEMFC